jgi:hypothetical protein
MVLLATRNKRRTHSLAIGHVYREHMLMVLLATRNKRRTHSLAIGHVYREHMLMVLLATRNNQKVVAAASLVVMVFYSQQG